MLGCKDPSSSQEKQPTEFGIDPDYNVALKTEDWLRGEDTIIEFARRLLKEAR